MRPIARNWVIWALLLTVFAGCGLSERKNAPDAEKRAVKATNTVKLTATSNVDDCISVEAVLLSHEPASKLFSGWVADNYAVVKTTISNHCDDKQFILHDIYFDYSKWALSGVFKSQTQASSCPATMLKTPKDSQLGPVNQPSAPKSAVDEEKQDDTSGVGESTRTEEPECPPDPDLEFTHGTEAGQVATVGALDVEYQLTEAAVLSRRNIVMNSLSVLGETAQAFSFVWGPSFGSGVGAFNKGFVDGVKSAWPDRAVDQEKYLLSLGYRTDQHTAIAKDDHGSYYAFFPLSTFLTPYLKSLFLKDPAAFLNPAESFLAYGLQHSEGEQYATKAPNPTKEDAQKLRSFLLGLVAAARVDKSAATETEDAKAARLIIDLTSPCPGNNCPFRADTPEGEQRIQEIIWEKNLFAFASLNVVKIVARGVMTIETSAVPCSIDKVTFDKEKERATWTVTKPEAGKKAAPNDLTGTIEGKFLNNCTPEIVDLTVPGVKGPKVDSYIDAKSLQVVPGKSSDTSLPFKMQIVATLPEGAVVTFQATRKSEDSDKSVSTKTESNKYPYTVNTGTPTAPTLSEVTIDGQETKDVWQTPGKLNGTATGSNLEGATITVSKLDIGGTAATVDSYIDKMGEVPKTSSASKLDFQFTLLKAVPDGAKLTFVVSPAGGGQENSAEKEYTTPKIEQAKDKTAAKKPKAGTQGKQPKKGKEKTGGAGD